MSRSTCVRGMYMRGVCTIHVRCMCAGTMPTVSCEGRAPLNSSAPLATYHRGPVERRRRCANHLLPVDRATPS